MKPFAFVGRLAASKSMLNRLLVAQSYAPDLQIHGDSDCEDVRLMRQGVAQLNSGQPLQVGSAGTVLRFLALRASRIPGRHRLEGHPRLFARPQEELVKILRQLGVQSRLMENAFEVESSGWKMHGDTVLVPSERSSQFASALLLNSWDIPFDVFVSLGGRRVSEGYWRMSVRLAEQMGMKIDFWDSDFRVPKGQRPLVREMTAEIDMSSAFALAALAAVHGQATFLDFPPNSLQPDAQFVPILQRMGVPLTLSGRSLRVETAARLNGVTVNLKSSPDLFPVLAALCALSEGESDLFGAPQLVHKESDRLSRMATLIAATGRKVEVKADGLRISGARHAPRSVAKSVFSCDHDHRLAFAAAVLVAAGFPIEILQPEVVGKSFPHFWDIVGWRP